MLLRRWRSLDRSIVPNSYSKSGRLTFQQVDVAAVPEWADNPLKGCPVRSGCFRPPYPRNPSADYPRRANTRQGVAADRIRHSFPSGVTSRGASNRCHGNMTSARSRPRTAHSHTQRKGRGERKRKKKMRAQRGYSCSLECISSPEGQEGRVRGVATRGGSSFQKRRESTLGWSTRLTQADAFTWWNGNQT